MSSFTPTGRLLSRVAAQANSSGIRTSNLSFTANSKVGSPRKARTHDENGNCFFTVDGSEVDSEDTVID